MGPEEGKCTPSTPLPQNEVESLFPIDPGLSLEKEVMEIKEITDSNKTMDSSRTIGLQQHNL